MTFRAVNSKARRGAVAAQITIALSVLLGITALTIDGGLLQAERRRAQATADAAALAAAADLFKRYNTNKGSDPSPFPARESALAIAAANGYDGTNSVITPNTVGGSGQPQHGIWIPPISGEHIGQPGYAEVVVQYNQKRYFSRIFGSSDIPVRARAVARGLLGPSDAGLVVLNPTVARAVDTSGNGRITVAGKIVVDSNATNAIFAWGNSVILAKGVDVVGGISQIANAKVYAPETGSTAEVHTNDSSLFTPDPLASVGQPSSAGLPVIGASQTQAYIPAMNETMQPGLYRGGVVVVNSGVKMASGLYYVERGDFVVAGGDISSLSGGVMIYLTKGANSTYAKMDLQVAGTVNLGPITTGPYTGITIFQDRTAPVSVTNNTINIAPAFNSIIRGTIYAPRAAIRLGGNNVTLGDSYIVDRVTLNGNSIINIPAAQIPIASRKLFGLVE